MSTTRILGGLGWTTLGTAAQAVVQVAVIAALARLLPPAAFGLVAMTAVATRLAGSLAQLGMVQALIQRPVLEPAQASAALLLTGGMSMSLAIVVVLLAPAAALAFQEPLVADLLRVHAWSLPLFALAALPLALLRRQSRFAAASAIEWAGYALGYGGTAVGMALAGFGVWSLVVAGLAYPALMLVLGFAALRFGWAWPVPRSAWRPMLATGVGFSAIGVAEFVWSNLESMVLGRALGPAALGLFNRAQTVASLPVEQAVTAGSKVLFPALAQWQDERSKLADGFMLMLMGAGFVSVALAAGVGAAAADVVALLLGPNWVGAVPLVQALSVGVPMAFIYMACGITLDSVAAIGPKLRWQLGLLAIKALAIAAALSSGLAMVVWMVVLAEGLRALAGLRLVALQLPVDRGLMGRLAAVFAVWGGLEWAAVRGVAGAVEAWPLGARVLAEAGAAGAVVAGALAWALWWLPAVAPLRRFAGLARWRQRVFGPLPIRS